MSKQKQEVVEEEKPRHWLNFELAHLGVWTFVLFSSIAFPPLFGLSNPAIQGIMIWMLLLMNALSWFSSSFQRYLELVYDG